MEKGNNFTASTSEVLMELSLLCLNFSSKKCKNTCWHFCEDNNKIYFEKITCKAFRVTDLK